MASSAERHWPLRGSAREQRHRRFTLLAIAVLLLLGMAPVFGHHLPHGIETRLGGAEHIGAICLTALHLLLEPVHGVFHLLVLGGFGYALWDRGVAWSRARRALRALDAHAPTPGDAFWRAAVATDLDPQRLRVGHGLPNPAFTIGWLRPRVYVATGLADRLSRAELESVLAHERAHVVRRDPLRLSLLHMLACALFWLPMFRRLASDLADEVEVLADDAAAAGRPLVLASAILSLAGWRNDAAPPAAVGFQRADLLDRRVRRLAGEDPPPASHITRRSMLTAAAALLLVWSSGALMAHPLPSSGMPADEHHCDHRHEWPISHLFCLGWSFTAPPEDCPHGDRSRLAQV
ncbi:MAG TPA: M56 family metallopeptidase [Gemmatimonadaceae bacterium]|nr:M56 family metallopeptidase [Gemmatimonadaceae bacterium]